jgi:hypothetical protein
VVDKVALGRVFSEYFGFPCQSSFHQILHHHNHRGQATIGQSMAAVPSGTSWTPPPTKRIRKKVQYSPVNCYWSSTAQSFLVSSPVEIHHVIYIRSNTAYVFRNGVSSSTREKGRVGFYELHHICCTVFSHECTRTHAASR